MNENKTIINWYPEQVPDAHAPNKKKGVFPIQEMGNQTIKIRHICDQSIARCNKNMATSLIDNKRERQETIEGKHTKEIAKVKTLRK